MGFNSTLQIRNPEKSAIPMVQPTRRKPGKQTKKRAERDPDESRVSQMRHGLPENESFFAAKGFADVAQNLNFKHREKRSLSRRLHAMSSDIART